MAENKGIMLAKSVQKHAGRAKEKILQNLGKVDRTADEIFDDHLNNFNRQQQNANRLQKEFNNYIRCIRAAQTASKSLMDAIAEIYEPQWSGYEALQAQAQSSESLWQDFAHKLADQVLIPLNTYTGQFPEMKKKVEKRNRKLIDYDGQRHSYQSLQANANKRKDDVKLTKGRDQLEEARRTYELLNTELHDELPALYDSRILFLVTNLQTLFATEQVFHNETAKIYSELEAIVDKLATESQRGSNTLRKATVNAIKSASPVQSPIKQMNNANITNSIQYQNTNGSANPPSPSSSSTQESRLDNVSPTPESNAYLLRGGGASVSGLSKMDASDTTAGNMENDAASIHSTNTTITTTTTTTANKETEKATAQLNSPNANTTTSTTNVIIKEACNENSSAAMLSTEEKITSEMTNSSATKEDVDMNNAMATEGENTPIKVTTTNQVTEMKKNEQMNGNDMANGNANNTVKDANKTTTSTTTTTTATKTATATATATNGNNTTAETTTTSATTKTTTAEEDQQSNKTKLDATTTDLPPGVLYRVKATYGYVKEDVDELSFEVGDIIRVIEYDDPEDQEEGWLMGEKEGTTEKGLFPANFTRPL